MDLLTSTKNYTIVFNNGPPPGRSLKVAANNILSQENSHSISDYYQQKFKKKTSPLEEVTEENEDAVKKNNFITEKSVKKREKTREKAESEKRVTTGEKPKLVKSNDGWKKEFDSEKDIDLNVRKESERKISYTPVNVPKPQKQNIPINKPVPKPEKKTIDPKPSFSTKPKESNPKSVAKTANGKKPFSQVYEGADRNLVEQLQKEISECPNITFDDIAELDNAKGLLQEAVLLPRMMP